MSLLLLLAPSAGGGGGGLAGSGPLVIAGTGAFTAAGGGHAGSGTLDITGAGSVTATGGKSASGTLSIVGTAALITAGVSQAGGPLNIAGSGGATFTDAVKHASGTAAFGGTATFAAAGTAAAAGTLDITGDGTMTATGIVSTPVRTVLVTVEELAAYLQRDVNQATAELALAGASAIVREYCRWGIARNSAATLVLDASGSRVLNLPTLKLNAVRSVTVDGTELDPSEYTWSAGGQLYREAGWPRGFRTVTAVVDHGHDPIPDDVRIVVCAIAARYLSNPENLRSKSIGGISRSYVVDTPTGADFTQIEAGILHGHRLP